MITKNTFEKGGRPPAGWIFALFVFYSVSLVAWEVPERVIELSEPIHPENAASYTVAVDHHQMKILEPALEAKNLYQTEVKKQPGQFLFQKTPTKLSASESARLEYHQAMHYINRNEPLKAEPLLMHLLEEQLDDHSARIALASLYLEQGNVNSAEPLLLEGLKIDEYHPDFLRLTAVVYDRKRDPEKALNFLSKIKDHQRRDKQIVSFLGYLYQKTGHYSLARQEYFRLLQSEPENPLWLLGVSMAFDFEGQRDAALEGYRQLSNQNNIEASIVKYARNRIVFLRG